MPASTLTLTTPMCEVVLVNGAQFSNVFWQVRQLSDRRNGLRARWNHTG